MSGFYQGGDDPAVTESARGWALKAEDWAIKLDGPVEGTSYSAQFYANSASNFSAQAQSSAAQAASSAQQCADILAQIQNQALDDLVDVNAAAPSEGQQLTYQGGVWVPAAASVASVNAAVMERLRLLEEFVGMGGNNGDQ